MTSGVLVIGGSVGGVRTARALRAEGFDGPIRIVEAEDEPPYDKPPLSKTALGQDPRVPLLAAEEARESGIELLLGRRAVALDPGRRAVRLDDGTDLPYDDLVIATGVRARRLAWAGEGVHVLRTLADSTRLRADLIGAEHILVVGAGFIGAEAASLCRSAQLEVCLVDPAPVPMARFVGAGLGERFVDLHRRHGVDTRFGVVVEALDRVGGRWSARLSDGTTVFTDAVLVGVGAEVDLSWLAGSGLRTEDGIVCDEHGRADGVPGVFAVGDVARWYQPRTGTSTRIEHWTNAVEQAACVARTIVRPDELLAHDPVAYVWSDQYDWKIQLFGARDPGQEPVVLEQSEPFRLAAVWQDADGRASGGVTVGWPKASVLLRKAIAAQAPAAEVLASLGATAVPA